MTIDAAARHDEPALFRQAPALRGRVPWLPLGRFPTPVEDLDLPGFGRLLVKRDDRCADGYAGNKVRKLEFLLADARAAGARRLITAGAAGSHHALATAFHGRRHGFDVTLVLFPQPVTPHVADILLMDHAAGAELRWVARMEAVPYGVWRARFAHRHGAPRVIPPGGSSEVGTLGYVSAALELADQLRDGATVRPSRIHVAGGTLGTAAGIAIGLAWAGLRIPVIATRITSRIVTNERVLDRLLRRTTSLLRDAGAEPPAPADAASLVHIRHDQIGTGYGRTTPAADEALQRFRELGLDLDVTYTAKAAAGVLADPAARADDAPPLFWHTLSAVEPRDLLPHATRADLPAPIAAFLASAPGQT
jgi:1-aminocyclopropane-1-carboxylate deaminase/D-cysteine desulfhydrase-like pyridoxal-dependent ACC family enzyme